MSAEKSIETYPNEDAEKYIGCLLSKSLPYEVEISGGKSVIKCKIDNYKFLPPGSLTSMFAKYVIDNDLAKGKVVADVSFGSFAMGMVAEKNGAERVIGIHLSEFSYAAAKQNVRCNEIHSYSLHNFHSKSKPFSKPYAHKIDVILSGLPWDTISQKSFQELPEEKRELYKTFYDIDDEVTRDFLTNSWSCLSKEGRVFMTADQKHIARINRLCEECNIGYNIVKAEDIHNEGNPHYILELTQMGAIYSIIDSAHQDV